MPYAANSELPDAVRTVLPPRAQRVFRVAFNGAQKRGLSEEKSFASAWGAVRSAGWHRPAGGGEWVKKIAVAKQPDARQVHHDRPLAGPKKPPPPDDDEDDEEDEAALKAATLTFEVTKIDEDQHLVFGWLSVIEENGEPVVDLQGHIIDEATMETAAFNFLLDHGVAGEMHERIGIGDGVVASMPFTKALQDALGINLGKIGWFIGLRVDATAFAKVKDGTYRAFSLGGLGVLEDMVEAA